MIGLKYTDEVTYEGTCDGTSPSDSVCMYAYRELVLTDSYRGCELNVLVVRVISSNSLFV